MKLDFVHLSGFRGYQKPIRIDFSESFTVIDGRNGVGKSTIFDAVEFALTGTITKYLDAKSDRESVADYLWWIGSNEVSPIESFVEVGFADGEEHFAIRRTPLDSQDLDIGESAEGLFDPEFAPNEAIHQLCASTIIRDEHIARLSLDLKEGERYSLLRDAIGAADAGIWIKRAQALLSSASGRVRSADSELNEAKRVQASAMRQLDQARAALPAASLAAQAAFRLQSALRTGAPADQLSDIARRRLANIASEIDKVGQVANRLEEIGHIRERMPLLQKQVDNALESVVVAELTLSDHLEAVADTPVSTFLSTQARQLHDLVDLGRKLDLREGHCPLCESAISPSHYAHGLEAALTIARQLDARAVDRAEKERAVADARSALAHAEEAHRLAVGEYDAAKQLLDRFDERLESVSLAGASSDDIQHRLATLEAEHQAIASDLKLVDTVSLDQAMARAAQDQESAHGRLRRAEGRLGHARLAESRAKALHDAARRAVGETLDQRLERILPLMSELYRRLRPHPIWNDIEYSVRGDIQRFLKLQVGDGINPQFVFSSGQRRATGLAFLLSVNLSITWSRWRSILLDDPVQHVDDFRTVHLAEVLAHLCESGRQIICAVEDSALADLMCRRLPSSESAPGKRVTLGTDSDGALAIIKQEQVPPLSRRALVVPGRSLIA